MKNKIFILFILIFMLTTGSVFGATAPMLTNEISENIIDYFANHCDGFYSNTSRVMTFENLESCKTMLENFDYTKLTTYWNENINTILTNYSATSSMDFNFTNIAVYGQINNLNDYYLIFTFSNNSSPGDNLLSFAQITQQAAYNTTFEVYNENSHAYYLKINIQNGDINVNNSRSMNNMRSPQQNFYYYYPENLNIRIDNVSMYMYNQLALTNTQEIYFRSMNDSTLNNYYIIGNVYNTIIPPDIPGSGDTGSGDNSGDTGGGTTSPSGDNPGTTTPDYSEKLDNIQGSIDNVNDNLNNIENKIPTSGDITQAQVNGNKEYWGENVDVSSGDFESDVSGMITDIMDTASGEFTDNEVFEALNKAEIGFINVISGQAEDFKISWNDVIYLNTKLIPAGEVNFSQMARENEALGKVKEYLNIIASAMLGFSLIKYIYNLILSTLGIDNNYLYEGNSQEKGITETVTYTTDFKTGKTVETKTRKEGNTTFINRREF